MPFTRPSLTDLQVRIANDIFSRLPAIPQTTRYNLLKIFADTEAGAFHSLYGALDFYADQLFPDTAEGEFLDQLLQWRGLTRHPATFAEGGVIFTGTDATVVPLGTELVSTNGELYTTTEVKSLAGSTLISVKAENAGTIGNLDAGQILTLTIPITGVDSEATVGPGDVSGGKPPETDEAYRARGLAFASGNINRYGKTGDWIFWAQQASSEVEKVFETKNFGNLGKLMVHVLGKNNQPVSPAGITTVINYLNPIAPVGVLWDVTSPTPVSIDFSISVLPSSSQNQASVSDAMKQWFEKNSHPGKTINISDIQADAFVNLPSLNVNITHPTGSLPHAQSIYPILGVIIYA